MRFVALASFVGCALAGGIRNRVGSGNPEEKNVASELSLEMRHERDMIFKANDFRLMFFGSDATVMSMPTSAPKNNRPTKPPKDPKPKRTLRPSSQPTLRPIRKPTRKPTSKPISPPTKNPTRKPTVKPTPPPSNRPTVQPSQEPVTKKPTKNPTFSPTKKITEKPVTPRPTKVPSSKPTSSPSEMPTDSPITISPTNPPSVIPTQIHTSAPTEQPVVLLSERPTFGPGKGPTSTIVPSPAQNPSTAIQPVSLPNEPSASSPVASPDSITAKPTGRPVVTESTSKPTLACNVSPSLRLLLIRVRLNTVSTAQELMEDGTPQKRALMWLVQEDPRSLCPNDDSLFQRYTLAVFYYATRGDRWTECDAPDDFKDENAIKAANERCTIEPIPDSGSDAWLTPGDECQWGGVVCDEGAVNRIEIGMYHSSFLLACSLVCLSDVVRHTDQNGLSGFIATELQVLTSLKYLKLENGVISGVIPEQIGNMKSLEIVDLNFNLINGALPAGLFNMLNLQQLDLNDNRLTGTIGSEISSMANVTYIQLHGNALRGTIPSEIGQLSLLGMYRRDDSTVDVRNPRLISFFSFYHRGFVSPKE